MECHVCLGQFDATERRPKVLPCGHSFCLKCLQRLPIRKCPIDKKVFRSSPEALTDNFIVLEASYKPNETALPRPWCRRCNKEAVEHCLDEHPVCSLKKARAEDAVAIKEALGRQDDALGQLGKTVDDAFLSLELERRQQLEQKRTGLAAARVRLEDAQGADAAVWEQAKQAAARAGLSWSAAQLVADLADPTTSCSLTVRRGAGGDEAWRAEVRPAEDAAARLLLSRLACSEGLQQQGVYPAGPVWQKRSQEAKKAVAEMTVQEMAAMMLVGSRTGRQAAP